MLNAYTCRLAVWSLLPSRYVLLAALFVYVSVSMRVPAVNLPGSYYVINGNTIDQVDCPVDTYSPGLKKQRAW
jgi:hypothetical protein